jgi:hypothetical protein
VLFKQFDQHEKARAAFEKCLECAPDSIVNRFEYVNLRRILCDWDGVDEEERYCLDEFRKKPVAVAPFQLISLWSSRDTKPIRVFSARADASVSASYPAISSSMRLRCFSLKSWKNSTGIASRSSDTAQPGRR